jgi:hypothetical protein
VLCFPSGGLCDGLDAALITSLKLVATSAEMPIAMPLNGSDRGSRADRRTPAATSAYMPTGRRLPLTRTDRIVRRCWRRSQAEKTALAYQEAGYAVVVSEEPRGWSIHKLGQYAVVVSEKLR